MAVFSPPSLACDWVLQNIDINIPPLYQQNKSVDIPPLYLAQAITYSLLLPVSFVGLILNIVVICRKKTTFLVRGFNYFSFAVTLLLGILWLNSIAAFNPDGSMVGYCRVMVWSYSEGGLSIVFLMITISNFITSSILARTVYLVTGHSLLGYVYSCDCDCINLRQSPSLKVCLEALVIVLTIVLPLLFLLTLCVLSMLHGRFENLNASYEFFTALSQNALWKVSLAMLSASVIVSLVGDIILLFRFCFKRWLPTRRDLSLKTLVVFLISLPVTALAYTLFLLFFLYVHMYTMPDQKFSIAVTALLTPLAFFPFFVFCLANHSTSTPSNDGHAVSVIEHDLQTPGQEVDPPSTRVSLPADTTEHAPNLLRQSTAEPTEVTPLLKCANEQN